MLLIQLTLTDSSSSDILANSLVSSVTLEEATVYFCFEEDD